jgi:hypothetical protein
MRSEEMAEAQNRYETLPSLKDVTWQPMAAARILLEAPLTPPPRI